MGDIDVLEHMAALSELIDSWLRHWARRRRFRRHCQRLLGVIHVKGTTEKCDSRTTRPETEEGTWQSLPPTQ
jgi:hypothetical protein